MITGNRPGGPVSDSISDLDIRPLDPRDAVRGLDPEVAGVIPTTRVKRIPDLGQEGRIEAEPARAKTGPRCVPGDSSVGSVHGVSFQNSP